MRIIAGSARGRRLTAPPAGTRPTSDRVREALFSSLAAHAGEWAGTRVLDLYAGSGALGLEALSRGAESAILVERDRRAAGVAERNAAAVGLSGARVVVADVAALARRPVPTDGSAPADRVLADPPYELPAVGVAEVLERLADSGWIAPGAWAVVERPARDPAAPWPAGWAARERRRYGDTALWYGQRT